ncbi:diguanylate cyclase [Alteromonas sp. ASW11-36]|uniref:diguanylate cyclase n=1 Tax=Alteromonas arenosi TaxID=3055817 RepID=A0ABT7STR0_9ALTE|nr:diguanylate cyclase [Alteromonas sp. ASW11-36]MDM7859585.1 diguanylate cyclase [Alteromonas sp. ASW11-36]
MTMNYMVSLSVIALLSIAVHAMLDNVIAHQTDSGQYINVSGQQRMLSQRASLFTLEYLYTGNANAKATAERALQKMQMNHHWLLAEHRASAITGEESPLSNEIQALYFSPPHFVDNQIQVFSSSIEQAISQNSVFAPEQIYERSRGFMQLAREPLLESFDTVVQQYELEARQEIAGIRQIQNIVLGIIILTILIEALFIFRPIVSKVGEYAKRLQNEAFHDELSGLLNRRAYNALSEQYFANHQRYQTPLSVLIIDIDNTRLVNDKFGYGGGDAAFNLVAQEAQKCSRASDFVARIGGDELAILLPNTDLGGASQLAEKIRQRVESSVFHIADTTDSVTVSIGISAGTRLDASFKQLFRRTEQALQDAKASGGNTIRVLEQKFVSSEQHHVHEQL